MRFFPILTALAVIAVLYLLVFERDRLLAVARNEPVAKVAVAEDTEAAARPAAVATRAVAVVAFKSTAQVVESAVLLRGQSEAARQVRHRKQARPSGLGVRIVDLIGVLACCVGVGDSIAVVLR